MHQLASLFVAAIPLFVQDQPSIRSLFEAGKNDQVVERVASKDNADPADLYLGALSAQKAGQGDRANDWLNKLAGGDNPAWKAIGESARALASGNEDEALAAPRERSRPTAGCPGRTISTASSMRGRTISPRRRRRSPRRLNWIRRTHTRRYYAGTMFYRIKPQDLMAVHFERS